MIQAALLVLTAAAFHLTTSQSSRARRVGPLVGILAQTTWAASVDWHTQWGIGAVTLFYLGKYLQLAWRVWR